MENFLSKQQALLVQLGTDSEYAALTQTYTEACQAFQLVVSALKPSQREIIYQYLGILAEMQMREIELALMLE